MPGEDRRKSHGFNGMASTLSAPLRPVLECLYNRSAYTPSAVFVDGPAEELTSRAKYRLLFCLALSLSLSPPLFSFSLSLFSFFSLPLFISCSLSLVLRVVCGSSMGWLFFLIVGVALAGWWSDSVFVLVVS
jgi:hypothetical protein